MSLAPANILIVDDLRENLLALEALIRLEGRAIYQAQSGEAALDLMLEHEFALAILDVQMPGMTGLELAELMRGTDKTRGIPIVFVSAAAKDLNYAFAGYESGAVDFLYKPLDTHAVRSKVSAFVEMFRQRQRQDALLAELQAAQAQLQRAVQMRDDFMSMVSHELRTPLNTLFLQAQLRRRIAAGAQLSPEKIQSMVERDEQQIRNILRLIDDMLDVSRLRQGTLSIAPKPADMAVLVRRVVESHAEQAAAVGSPIEYSANEAIPGAWDEFRIEQVVANLLTNAMRYGGGKPIQVTAERRGDQVAVTVRDHGIGIAPEDQARIFGQFERAAGSQDVPGLGLGLYITHQIVQAHHGRIEVHSARGEGAAFTVTLPLDPSAEAPS